MNTKPSDSKIKIIYVLIALYIFQVISFLKFGILRVGSPPVFLVFFLLFIVTCIKFRSDHFPDTPKCLTVMPLILALYFLISIFNRNGDLWWGLTPFYAKPDYVSFLFLSIFQWLCFPNITIYIKEAVIKITTVLFSWIEKGLLPKLALSAALFFAFMLFRERGISRDGIDWVRTTENNTWYLYLREIYTMLIFRVLYVVIKGLGMTARNSIAMASAVSGVVFLWIVIKIYSSQADAPKGKNIFYILGLFSGYGLAQIFFGQIEVYGLFIAAVCGYFFLALSYLDHKIKLRLIGIYFAFMMGIHIAAIWLLPSLFFLPWIRNKEENFLKGKGIRETLDMIFFMILSGAILLFPITYFYYDLNISKLWERGFQSVTDTPDARVFLSFNNIFSRKHTIDLANIFFYNWGGIFFILLYLFLHKSFLKNWEKKDFFILTALIPALIFGCTYRLGRTAMEDWNSFSLLTFVMAFFAMQGFSRIKEKDSQGLEHLDILTMILIFNCENLYLILSKAALRL